jgi:AcrR family transcriptional regulator
MAAEPRRAPRGRPAHHRRRDVRAALISAARGLFLRYGYRAVSSRQIAARARVDPAMVQYYFGSKRGLFVAMVEDAAAPMKALLDETAAGPDVAEPATFLALYMRTVAANPWIPALMIREVLPAGGTMREDIVEKLIRPMAARLLAAMQRAQAAGQADDGLAPVHAVVTLLSLAMWPFLVRPLLEPVFGLALKDAPLESLIDHTTRVLRRGLAPGPRSTPARRTP